MGNYKATYPDLMSELSSNTHDLIHNKNVPQVLKPSVHNIFMKIVKTDLIQALMSSNNGFQIHHWLTHPHENNIGYSLIE